MELPVASASYQPDAQTLVRAIKRAAVVLKRTMAQEVRLACGTAFVDAARPGVRMSNCATDLTPVDDQPPDAVLDAVLQPFADAGATCHGLDSSDDHWQEALLAAVQARGYETKRWCVFAMAGFSSDRRPNDAVQIIPARAAYAEAKRFFVHQAEAESNLSGQAAEDLAAARIDQLDEPRLDMFLARIDNQPVGIAGVLTLGNIGVLHNVFTSPDQRGKGVGGTLMHKLVDVCNRAQFEAVIVERAEGCWAIPFYESLGFAQVGSYLTAKRSGGGEA